MTWPTNDHDHDHGKQESDTDDKFQNLVKGTFGIVPYLEKTVMLNPNIGEPILTIVANSIKRLFTIPEHPLTVVEHPLLKNLRMNEARGRISGNSENVGEFVRLLDAVFPVKIKHDCAQLMQIEIDVVRNPDVWRFLNIRDSLRRIVWRTAALVNYQKHDTNPSIGLFAFLFAFFLAFDPFRDGVQHFDHTLRIREFACIVQYRLDYI